MRVLTGLRIGLVVCLAVAPVFGQGGDEFDEFEEEIHAKVEDANIPDPLIGINRAFYWGNDKIYFWLLKPVAQGYGAVVPKRGRVALGHFFDNLQFPLRVVNAVLQFKWEGAGTEVGRFAVNSTVGVLGFSDYAYRQWGWRPCREDFGQTFAYYGAGPGIALHLPILGPSNLRDALGKIPAYFVDPLSYIDPSTVGMAVSVGSRVNDTSLSIGFYEKLKANAVDPYSFFKRAYEQRRIKEIKE
ncbi:MAG: VacJ family lipoprotein [Lentisphaerae bacterium]|nr:VacJ family lipoprotein [Lentisphaerota bacterium]